MPDKIFEAIVESMPFVGLAAGKLTINTAQIIQAVLVAGFIALFASVLMIPKLQITLENIDKRIDKIEVRFDKFENDFYKPQVSDG